jgi:hypothetical protein
VPPRGSVNGIDGSHQGDDDLDVDISLDGDDGVDHHDDHVPEGLLTATDANVPGDT